MPPCVQCAAFNHNSLTTHKPLKQAKRDKVLHNSAPAIANVGSESNINAPHPTQHRNTRQKKSPYKMPPRLPFSPHPYTGTAAEHLACGTSHHTSHKPPCSGWEQGVLSIDTRPVVFALCLLHLVLTAPLGSGSKDIMIIFHNSKDDAPML